VAFFGAADMVLEQVHRHRRRRREARPVTAPAVPADMQQAVRAAYLASVQAGDPLSQRAMAARFGLSRRKIRQLVPKSTASGTGHLGEGEAA
jgi:transcriptional regulator GlxA family with amidase domain